ncbi:MAG: PAS-domain containing protein [Alphaproteobacteria bacterium]|nr:PAS-domain containing protein [Alphaproteobacteria bacterium]
MIVLAAVVFLAVVIALGGLTLYARARLTQAEAERDAAQTALAWDAANLDTAPLSGFLWRGRSGDAIAIASGTEPFSDFLAALDPAAAAAVAAAVAELRAAGTAFDTAVRRNDGRSLALAGRRSRSGDALLWVTDISRQSAAEAAESESLVSAGALRAMLEAMPLPVWRRDPQLTLVDCNAAYAAALDTTRETALAEGRELASESDRARAVEQARAAAAGTGRTEAHHIVIGGSRRLIEITEIPDETGGTIGFALDRTDLENAEAELARHISAHGGVLERIHAAVAIYGADKRLKFANSAFAELWGIETDWLVAGPSLDELLERLRERRRIPEFADFRAFKRQQLAMFTSLIEPQREMLHLPDDRTLSLSVSPHPLGGLIFVYEDVTDRLALERSYNTLIEVQRESLDNLFEGIAVFGSDGRLKLHNPAYRRLWGLSESDIAGEPHISEIVEKTRAYYDDGVDWPTRKAGIIASISAGSLLSDRLDRRDGSVMQVATVPLPDGNVLVSYQDMTDTARVERALRERAEALETAGRLKSEFIANVSYELRTPLNAIIGFAEILSQGYFGPLTPRQLDYSRGILDSSHRLLSLINDILDLATIEAGYMTLETRRIDVHDMLQSVLTLTRERARNQNLDLTLECPAAIGAINADERRLKQAMFNLVSNAIKFTPSGGSIRIAARRDGPDLVLSVSDTGVGIPAAEQARVFEKFERGDPSLHQTGAGLGLSLVKNLIELHGGAVTMESRAEEGTTVSCRLPTSVPAVSAAAIEPATVAGQG